MTKHTTVFGDLLRHLSRSEFESAVSDHKGDFRTRAFSCAQTFQILSLLIIHHSHFWRVSNAKPDSSESGFVFCRAFSGGGNMPIPGGGKSRC